MKAVAIVLAFLIPSPALAKAPVAKTVTGMERRIRKLESVLLDGLAALTIDELEIHLLEINRLIAAHESLSPGKREDH